MIGPLLNPVARDRRLPRGVRVAALVLVAAAGCTVGPDFERPAPPAAERLTREALPPETAGADVPGGRKQAFSATAQLSHDWWTLFKNPALTGLIERALEASPDLAAAQAALRQADELAQAQVGGYYPTVGVGFSPGVYKASKTLSPPLSTSAQKYQLHTAQVTVGYTVDVWGGRRRLVESMEAQAEAQRFQLEAARLTLTSTLVAAAIQQASLRGQIAVTRELIDLATRSVELVRRQFQAGAVSRLEVAAQESALAQIRQTLPPLELQLEQNRDLIAALAGGLPGDPQAEVFELSRLELPQELPLGVPSRLVEQRPDVRAAEALLHSASAQVGVASAARLPQLTLSASYGGTSTRFPQMFDPGNTFWTIVGSLTQTVFDGGTLLHEQRAAEAALAQEQAIYRKAVITAFQNVADALYALKSDAERLSGAAEAEKSAREAYDITLRQQQVGAVNYLSVLSAQQAYQQSVLARVQAQAARLSDTAALFQSLGGGWWNRPEAAHP
jgi:NodT family efflux transporter outer membrane factor (OMF) lipoprotein